MNNSRDIYAIRREIEMFEGNNPTLKALLRFIEELNQYILELSKRIDLLERNKEKQNKE